MKFDFNCRNCQTNEKLKQLAEQKLSKLEKYFGESEPSVKVTFKKQANRCDTEVMLDYSGKFVRATCSGENFYDNLDVILPKLEGQIRKYRTRFDKHNKNNAFKEDVIFLSEKAEEKQGQLVKEKKFKLTPLTVNEAIEEMELLGHSFYVFLEAKSNTVQVLYKRNDGDFGLIEPEF